MTGRGGEHGRAGQINRSPLAYVPNKILTYFAARRLRELARLEPQLSADTRIIEATDRALAEVEALVAGGGSVRKAG
jgi:succinoglycan biosynthesis protein ExoV